MAQEISNNMYVYYLYKRFELNGAKL